MMAMLLPLLWLVHSSDSGRPIRRSRLTMRPITIINDPSAEGGKRDIAIAAVAGLPVDQSLGNLEGKELRFGTSAGSDLRGRHHGRDLRLGQLHARQPESAGRPHAR